MAGKSKAVYVCNACGYETQKWYGCCPNCGEWNTFTEEVRTAAPSKGTASVRSASVRSARAEKLGDITAIDEYRYTTGLKELDRVLGGGIVKGSLILLSGDPGIGKSTILLQICQKSLLPSLRKICPSLLPDHHEEDNQLYIFRIRSFSTTFRY